MRAVFTVNLPTTNSEYPDDQKILLLTRSFGWEPMEVRHIQDESGKKRKYCEMAEQIFQTMPELALAEKDQVIFYGYLADEQTRFLITRVVDGQITLRLLHPELPKLQSATKKIVRKIIDSKIDDKPLTVSNQTVLVYERGHDDLVMKGRVIPKPLREAIRIDRKDLLLFGGSGIVGTLLLLALYFNATNNLLITGTMERMSTAMLTTTLVSALGLFQVYYEIRRNKLIAWKFTSEEQFDD